MFLSVGFATRDDFHGAWMTIEGLLTYHDEHVDQIVVVDNSPTNSKHAKSLRDHVKNVKKVKYLTDEGPASSCLPKSRVFTESDCEFAACCDSHVLFKPGAIAAVREFWRAASPSTTDILSGPCWTGAAPNRAHGTNQMMYEHEGYEIPKNADPHSCQVWRGGNLGVWVLDSRGLDASNPPFAVRKQGTGFFSMRKGAWVGFNPKMIGHGGNEAYLYEKVRLRRGTAWCLPAAVWVHRFGRPEGVPYAVRWEDRVNNYVAGFRELGRPDLERGALAHFRKICAGSVRTVEKRFGPTPDARAELCRLIDMPTSNACPEGVADVIRQVSRPGMQTLELGCGYSTLVFDRAGCTHVALEHKEDWARRVQASVKSKATRVLHVPLSGEPGSYFGGDPPSFMYLPQGAGYELILIDGPPNLDGTNHRDGALSIVPRLAAKNAFVIVDDTNRPGDSALSAALASKMGLVATRYADGSRKFDVLRPKLS